MKPFLVDVPVQIMIWTRPNCLKKQFEVLAQARPSILFLISDGGRNGEEWRNIQASRQIFESIDWDCTVYKLFMDENQGMYTMMVKSREFIWSKVDRCVFLEDDYVPAVSYFRYCAELLDKYKDDQRIQMICGYNPLGVYKPAAMAEQDYFFTENGWAIWGCACWKRSMENREFPVAYGDNAYIRQCLKDNMSQFWFQRADRYMRGELADNHIPGDEYVFAANSVLCHRVSIVPTRNLISNIGIDGEHVSAKFMLRELKTLFNSSVYELTFPLRHPAYVIDDKQYASKYEKALLLVPPRLLWPRVWQWIRYKWSLLRQGQLMDVFRKDRGAER